MMTAQMLAGSPEFDSIEFRSTYYSLDLSMNPSSPVLVAWR